MVNVYIKEAHPSDGWELDTNTSGETFQHTFGSKRKICYKQTHTLAERISVATEFMKAIRHVAKSIPLLVDDPETNATCEAYEAAPERLVLLDPNTRTVLFSSGQGPWQYSILKLEKFLKDELLLDAD